MTAITLQPKRQRGDSSGLAGQALSMASHTRELPRVTHSASCPVQFGVFPAMRIEKIGNVIGRLQGHTLCMTELATEWRVDLVVADQAIGHLREIRFRKRSR